MGKNTLHLFKTKGKEMNDMTGHNSDSLQEKIKEAVIEYADCDEQSAVLNDKRAEIRDRMENLGLDKKAFHDEYMRAKRNLKKKEGYDEGVAVCRDAIGNMDMDDLFDFVERRKQEKLKAKEEKAKARKAAKAEKAGEDQQEAA